VTEVTAPLDAVPVFHAEIRPMSATAEPSLTRPATPAISTLIECFAAAYRHNEAKHLDRLRELVDAEIQTATPPRRRGPAWQQAKRRLEQQIRRQTVLCSNELRAQGHTRDAIAELLNLTPRTLRHWEHTYAADQLAVVPLGRPSARSSVSKRQDILQFLDAQGLGVGVPTLHQQFPDLTRAELSSLLQRYRRVGAARGHQSVRVLDWRVAGRVWAIDFAEPTLPGRPGVLPPIDGCYPYLLAVRDLASGYQLCWLPVQAATAETTCAVLTQLFAVHGAPLVIKADNGPPFRAEHTKRFLENAGVQFLFSPPYWPGYNGALEAAIGSLKTRTARQAVGQAHAGLWTGADVSAAWQEANASRPRRLHGLSPAEAWVSRTAVSDVERVCFELAVEGQRMLARSEMGIGQAAELDHWQGSALDRKALERALVEHDYLLFRGRRLPLTIKAGKVTFFV
jgi:transposase InsO family protein